ncbi:MAG: putative transrane protein [Polaromonas sp.]|nr:putative transrane protein [Polaromonas sp.]
MQAPVRQRVGLLAAALWWGSLTALGFVVVPMLFMHLGSPAAAGAMAARLFAAQTWIGTGCALLMLIVFNQKDGIAQAGPAQAAMKFIVAGMLLALLVEFGVAPRIVSARADGGNLRLWHGLGSAMLLGQWLCAGFTLWRLSARPDR